MMPGEMADAINKHACHHMALNGVCRRNGHPCIFWYEGDKCSDYVHREDAVRLHAIAPKLRELVLEAAKGAKMVYVENGDKRYSDEDLKQMMNCIVLQRPVLNKYIDIDATRQGDYLIVVYEGIGAVIVDN